MTRRRFAWGPAASVIVALALLMVETPVRGRAVQDRLATMPGFEAYARMQQALRAPVVDAGAQNAVWADDSRSVTYRREGRLRRFDLETGVEADVPSMSPPHSSVGSSSNDNPCPRVPVDRGRQSACAASPDRTMKAFYRDRNLYVSRADGSGEVAVTKDGAEATRIKYGTASWVYGEELDQVTAIWWAPNGRRVAFYRMDERPVRDYYVLLNQTAIQSAIDIEAYPKAGTDNPIADVLVYDLSTRRTTTLDVRDGQAFANDVLGYYVFAVEWAPDGAEIRLHRTNRLQNALEFVGFAPDTGRCRRIVREDWPAGWTENRPTFRPLADGRRFIWASDRTGWRNFYLYEFSGRLLHAITALRGADVGSIVTVDERDGTMFYLANDGDTRLKAQLHRVRLDGTGDERLTDAAFHHRVSVSPDGRYVLDVAQTHQTPPVTRILTAKGRIFATIAMSNLDRFEQLKLRKVEQFSYLAADGATTLYGALALPSAFDPAVRYPVLLFVYGGPGDTQYSPTETFAIPPATTELGFLVATLGTRAVPGLGRHALDAVYRKLGQTEVDDFAAGVRALAARPYVDGARVGVAGVSYGGYVSLMALLRYPDVFAAASASSPVTDWRNYDTIYTERYMGLPDENPDGYDKGSAMRYAGDLRGRLLLYYGTADNNVHPSNSLQLIDAFARLGKSIDVQVGADRGHSSVPPARMLEFFVEHLILHPERLRVP